MITEGVVVPIRGIDDDTYEVVVRYHDEAAPEAVEVVALGTGSSRCGSFIA